MEEFLKSRGGKTRRFKKNKIKRSRSFKKKASRKKGRSFKRKASRKKGRSYKK